MIEIINAAAEIQAVCLAEGWQFCFIGGLALQRWGEPRETVDVDLTLLTGFGGEAPFIEILLRHFEGRISDAAAVIRSATDAQQDYGSCLTLHLFMRYWRHPSQ